MPAIDLSLDRRALFQCGGNARGIFADELFRRIPEGLGLDTGAGEGFFFDKAFQFSSNGELHLPNPFSFAGSGPP